MAYTCSFCGMEMSDDEKVCSLCGTKRETEQTTAVPDETADVRTEEDTVDIPTVSTTAAEATVAETPVTPDDLTEGKTSDELKYFCSNCGKEYQESTRFCSDCGGKIEAKAVTESKEVPAACKIRREKKTIHKTVCMQCGKEYKDGVRFCSDCGGKIETKEFEELSEIGYKTVLEKKTLCVQCGKEYQEGTRFCSDCGGKVEQKEIEKEIPVCIKEVTKNLCTKCGKEFPVGIHFCSSCGGKIETMTTIEEINDKEMLENAHRLEIFHPWESYDIYKQLARCHNSEACGAAYYLSQSLDKFEECQIWKKEIEKMANDGDPNAIDMIIRGYSNGYSATFYKKNEDLAKKWSKKWFSVMEHLLDKGYIDIEFNFYSPAFDYDENDELTENLKNKLYSYLKGRLKTGDMDAIEKYIDNKRFKYDNDFTDECYEKLHLSWETRAANGDIEAIEKIADSYVLGSNGYKYNKILAEMWNKKLHSVWERRAANGDACAAIKIAIGYSSGSYGYIQNAELAQHWQTILEKWAAKDSVETVQKIFEAYKSGYMGKEKKNRIDAIWHTKIHSTLQGLAESGDFRSIEKLADYYYSGSSDNGFEKNEETAKKWYRILREMKERWANNDDPSAIEWLAAECKNGYHGIAQDYQKAIDWYRKINDEKAAECCNCSRR